MSDIVAHLSQADLNSIAELVRQSIANSAPHPPSAPDAIKLSPSDIQAIVAGMKDASSGTGVRILTSDGALHLVDDSKPLAKPWYVTYAPQIVSAAQILATGFVGYIGWRLGTANHEIAQTQKEIAREKLNLEKFSRRVEYIEIVDKCFRRQVDSGFADGRIEFLNKLKEIRQKSGRISNVFSAQEEKLKERFIESPFHRLIELQEIQYQITAIFSLETGRAIQSLIACMRITQITRNECIMSVHSREKNMARLKRIIPICRARHQRVWQSLQEREFNGLKS